jgi:hypothetical protein
MTHVAVSKYDFVADEAMLTLINAAVENHENLQFPAAEDNEVVKLNNENDIKFYEANGRHCCQR